MMALTARRGRLAIHDYGGKMASRPQEEAIGRCLPPRVLATPRRWSGDSATSRNYARRRWPLSRSLVAAPRALMGGRGHDFFSPDFKMLLLGTPTSLFSPSVSRCRLHDIFSRKKKRRLLRHATLSMRGRRHDGRTRITIARAFEDFAGA